MSIVLCTISEGTATIMSDGKVLGCYLNPEHKCKFHHLTDDVIIGFAGHLYYCEESIDWYKSHLTNNPFDDFEKFQDYLIGLNDKFDRTFLLVGKYNNKLRLKIFSNQSDYKTVIDESFGKDDYYYTGIDVIDGYLLSKCMEEPMIPLETKNENVY